jgi:hypothetical protein
VDVTHEKPAIRPGFVEMSLPHIFSKAPKDKSRGNRAIVKQIPNGGWSNPSFVIKHMVDHQPCNTTEKDAPIQWNAPT